MSDLSKYAALLDGASLFRSYDKRSLLELGIERSVIRGLAHDQFQHQNGTRGTFLGALVVNYLSRSGILGNGDLSDLYVNAVSFSEMVHIDLSVLVRIAVDGRPIAIEKQKNGESDLFIAVSDLHYVVGDQTPSSSLTSLARQYFRSPSSVLQEEILEQSEYLIKYVVDRVARGLPKQIEKEDLHHEAVIGLLDALEKYNPLKSAKFETYAIWRINGAVADYLRSADFLSRSQRRSLRQIESIKEELMKRNNREPTRHECREEWEVRGYDPDSFDVYESSYFQVLSLDKEIETDDDHSSHLGDLIEDSSIRHPLDSLIQRELTAALQLDLEELPEKYREGIRSFILGEKTEHEIADRMGVSESRISQVIGEYVRSTKYFKRTKEQLGIKKVIHLKLGMSKEE